MVVWLATLVWLIRIGCLALLGLTILPFLHSGSWVVRSADFPRLQLLMAAGVVVLVVVTLALSTPWRREPWFWTMVLIVIAVWQSSYIVPFTPLWPRSVADADNPNLSLVVANLDFRNGEKADAAAVLEGLNADVYLLIEVDRAWAEALSALRESHPYRVEEVLDKGLGIVAWSRVPIQNGSIRTLVSERRPSVHLALQTSSGVVRFVGLHPTPPGLPIRDAAGRHDSRIRDAELMVVAEMVSSAPQDRWIVAGDFNDVAWSRTTKLFAETSGLLDPRVGRGLLNTYHAEYALLRYPLDHIFVSEGFTIGRFDRVRIPGSDHFAVRADFLVPSQTAGPNPTPSSSEEKDANELIQEGREDAGNLGRSPDEE